MSVIAFLPELRSFLKERGVIYTVRKYRYPLLSQKEATGVGNVIVERVGQVREATELLPYVGDSGFADLALWWKKIRHFIPVGDSMYLYRVSIKS